MNSCEEEIHNILNNGIWVDLRNAEKPDPPEGKNEVDKLAYDNTWDIKSIAWELAEGDPLRVKKTYELDYLEAFTLLTEMKIYKTDYL